VHYEALIKILLLNVIILRVEGNGLYKNDFNTIIVNHCLRIMTAIYTLSLL